MIKPLKQLDADELGCLFSQIDAKPDEIAQSLFPDQPMGHIAVTEQIGQWAINQKAVIEHSAINKPHIALLFDKICHRMWQQLPGYARSVEIKIE